MISPELQGYEIVDDIIRARKGHQKGKSKRAKVKKSIASDQAIYTLGTI